MFGHIDEGHFNETRLDGLNWAMIIKWPGEIPEGNGKQQALILSLPHAHPTFPLASLFQKRQTG